MICGIQSKVEAYKRTNCIALQIELYWQLISFMCDDCSFIRLRDNVWSDLKKWSNEIYNYWAHIQLYIIIIWVYISETVLYVRIGLYSAILVQFLIHSTYNLYAFLPLIMCLYGQFCGHLGFASSRWPQNVKINSDLYSPPSKTYT